jgi:ribonucleotide reductase beta subunit family protein with ferritin-like domain
MAQKRYSLFPIIHHDLWDMHEKLQGILWRTHEFEFGNDYNDLARLSQNERHFLKYVLAFFNQADGIINQNLALRFSSEVAIPEAVAFYTTQMYNETTHSETYSQIIEEYYRTDPDKPKIFEAIDNFPAIRKKAEWALKWLHSNKSFGERLIAFAVVEGVFFSGSFASIYWFKEKAILEALSLANEWISRDENIHCEFAVKLYKTLCEEYEKNGSANALLMDGVEFAPLSQERIVEIFKEAVAIEQEFLTEALPVRMIGMNEDMMKQYIECCADYWLNNLGAGRIYNVTDPFGFMVKLGMASKTNFFEKKVSTYTTNIVNNNISFDDDDDNF